MKKLTILVFIIFSIFNNKSIAQWFVSVPKFNVDTVFFKNLYFSDENHGFITGYFRSKPNSMDFIYGVFKSTDGGLTGTLILSDTSNDQGINSLISFGRDSIIVSLGREILKSTNAGVTWQKVLNNSGDLYKLADGSIFLYGEGGIYYSSNFGGSFIQRTNESIRRFSELKFLDAKIAIGRQVADNKIYVSNDSCKTWIFSGELTNPQNLKPVLFAFVDYQIIYGVIGGRLFRSNNGGVDWILLKNFGQNFNFMRDGLYVINSTDVLISYQGECYKSNDTGRTWCVMPPTPTGQFIYSQQTNKNGMHFINKNEGFLGNLSVDGMILYKTTNQGGPPCPSDTTIKGLGAELGFNQLKVFPNPSAGLLTLALEQGQLSQVLLFSMEGRLVFTQKLSEQEVTLQLPSISPGIYMLEVQSTANKVFRQKLVIE